LDLHENKRSFNITNNRKSSSLNKNRSASFSKSFQNLSVRKDSNGNSLTSLPKIESKNPKTNNITNIMFSPEAISNNHSIKKQDKSYNNNVVSPLKLSKNFESPWRSPKKDKENFDTFTLGLSQKKSSLICNKSESTNKTSLNSTKNWKKISYYIKGISYLKNHPTKFIISNDELERELYNYIGSPKKHLLKNSTNSFHYRYEEKEKEELNKIHLKERFLKVITEGPENGNLNFSLNQIIEDNLEKFTVDKSNENYLFNERLSNGLTLMYIACREGNFDVLKYMIKNKFNHHVKSKIDNDSNNYESCLQVATRWNHSKIVEYLLKHLKFDIYEIQEAIEIPNLNIGIKTLLYNYINKINRIDADKVFCIC